MTTELLKQARDALASCTDQKCLSTGPNSYMHILTFDAGKVASAIAAIDAALSQPASDVPFNPNAKCSPTATQCPRCNNPWNVCDKGAPASEDAWLDSALDKLDTYTQACQQSGTLMFAAKRELLDHLRARPAPECELYEHKKSGGVYELIAFGLQESDKTGVTIYRNHYTREVWVRPASEFNDGRFEKIEAAKESGK